MTKKAKKESFVLSGPTNFKCGIHLTPDNSMENVGNSSLPESLRISHVSDIEVYKKNEDLIKRRKKEEEKEEQKRIKEEEKRNKKEENIKKIAITEPLHVEHKLHVDENLNWTDADSLKLLNKIGEGAYGCVYRALHVPTNSELAVKTVPISQDFEESSGIEKEINILKQCRHDNVVSLYGSAFSDDKLWIIMDYCGGGSVKDFMKISSRTFTEQEIAALLYNVLKGLEYLHSISIIHRDLKSANILLTNSGEAKIGDFGVSYQVNNTLAKKNTVVGTPLFMSPESLDKGDYSAKADIWSLGITAIEMYDGVPPHNDEHIMRAMLLIAQSDPPTLVNPNSVSNEFNQFLSKCLIRDPDVRLSAKELLNDPFIANKDHHIVLQKMIDEFKLLTAKIEAEKLEAENEKKKKIAELKYQLETVNDNCNVDFPHLNREKPNSFIKRFENGSGKNNTIATYKLDEVDRHCMDLEEQIEIQKVFNKESEYYSKMSYKQLVDEIRGMKILLQRYNVK